MTSETWLNTLHRWTVRAARLTLVSALAAGVCTLASACASGGKHPDNGQDVHPVAIEIDNNLTVPTELEIYIEQGGIRQTLGSVPGGKDKSFKFTPASFGQPYYLIGIPQLERAHRSQQFQITGPETGTVVWNLQANILAFYDVLDATNVAPDTTKQAPASPPPATPPPPSPQRSR
jgi:hypothetical protein